MTNVEALKQLYVAFGGNADDVADVETIVDALKALYVLQGGDDADVAEITTNSGMIGALAGLEGLEDVTIAPCLQTNEYWGTLVSAMQDTDIAITNGAITGTLKYVASGQLVADWGEHHFIALKFTDPNNADVVKVGIKNPAALDSDMDAVIAVHDTTKPLKVIVEKDGVIKTQVYDLSGLTLANAPEPGPEPGESITVEITGSIELPENDCRCVIAWFAGDEETQVPTEGSLLTLNGTTLGTDAVTMTAPQQEGDNATLTFDDPGAIWDLTLLTDGKFELSQTVDGNTVKLGASNTPSHALTVNSPEYDDFVLNDSYRVAVDGIQDAEVIYNDTRSLWEVGTAIDYCATWVMQIIES